MAVELLNLNEIDGVIPPNQARSRDAQARLMRAGEQVFAEVGYDAAHVSDIAAAARCSIGSFYRRFRDKEALFHALQTQFAMQGRQNFDKFFAMPQWREAPVGEVMHTLVSNTARLIQRRSGFFRALFQRSLAGAGAIYFPALRASDENAGRGLAAFLRERDMAFQPDMERACVFALQSMEAVLIHRVLHVATPKSVLEPYLIDSLTKMMMAHLDLPISRAADEAAG